MSGHGASTGSLLDIVFEDEELLVVNKPAGLVCHPTKTDEFSSLISRARLHLGEGSRPQLVNRLDRETSGVTILAKDLGAARELRRLWENRQVRKEYLAIVHGHLAEDHGVIDAPLGKDEQSRVAIKDCVRSDGAPARTEFWVERHIERKERILGSDPRPEEQARSNGHGFRALDTQAPASSPRTFTLLCVVPLTGRKHQIRIHLAHVGHPLVGDKLYGGDEDFYLALVEGRLSQRDWEKLLLPYQALHARRVQFTWRDRALEFLAQPEPWFEEFAVTDGASGQELEQDYTKRKAR